jgi:hypothetical protein
MGWAEKEVLDSVWRGCNETLFGGSLRRVPRFHVFDSPVRAGFFTPGGRRDHIGVNVRYFKDLPLADLVDTVAHEALHQRQRELGLPVEHDRFFLEQCDRLGLDRPV